MVHCTFRCLDSTILGDNEFPESFQSLSPSLRKWEPTNMTIHWKALDEHFRMVPLKYCFSKISILKS
jgi:hypothetical protein